MKNLVFTLFLFFVSCQEKPNKNNISGHLTLKDSFLFKEISISISKNKGNLEKNFELQSYVVLSNQTLIGEVKRTLVWDDLIFILDDRSKIVCYNMKGELEYEINNQGEGPNEFGAIMDFGLDETAETLWLYDSAKRRISAYDIHSGKYKHSLPTTYMAPFRIAINKNGGFFFHTPDHFNYATRPEMHYSLLYNT